MEFGLTEALMLLDGYLAMSLMGSFVKWAPYSNTPKEERQDWMGWFVTLPIGVDIAYCYYPDALDYAKRLGHGISNIGHEIVERIKRYKIEDEELTRFVSTESTIF